MPPRLLLALSLVAVGCASTPAPVTAPRSPIRAMHEAAAAGPTSAPEGEPTRYEGHGEGSVPKEVLARFAPPPLDAEVQRRIEAMLDIRAPGAGVLSPDGKSLYFSWTVTGTSQLWRLDGPNRFPVQLTGGEDKAQIVDVTPDGKLLVIARDRKGEENPGLYLMAKDGGALRVVRHTPKVQTRHGLVTKDGKFLYFTANDTRPDGYAVYRHDIAKGTTERVYDEPGLWGVADERDGTLLLVKATGALTSEYHELDTKTGQLLPVLGYGESEEYEARYAAAPGELVVLTNKDSEYRRLYRYRYGRAQPKFGELDPITKEIAHDVSSFAIDGARTHIVYTVNERGYTRPGALDARSYAPIALPPFPSADHVTFASMMASGRAVTLTVSAPTAPARTYSYEWATKKLTAWSAPSSPELDTSKFAVAELTHYPARDGTEIPVFVRTPAACASAVAAEPCPVLVQFHGGPEGQVQPGFQPSTQLFVDAGFIVMQPNVRGSDGYGRTWLHADDGAKRLDVITDIEDAGRYARAAFARGGKSPRVGVLGGSYGGYSTLIAMSMFAGTFDAGVANVGMSNLLTFLKNTAPYRRALRISEYGDPDRDRAALERLSPVSYLDRVKGPLLLIQGANDPRVPVGEAIQMREALAARKLTVPLIVFPDEGHGAQKRGNKVLELGHTLAFFEKHLKGSAAHGDRTTSTEEKRP